MNGEQFRDRAHAGKLLAERLAEANLKDAVVAGLISEARWNLERTRRRGGDERLNSNHELPLEDVELLGKPLDRKGRSRRKYKLAHGHA